MAIIESMTDNGGLRNNKRNSYYDRYNSDGNDGININQLLMVVIVVMVTMVFVTTIFHGGYDNGGNYTYRNHLLIYLYFYALRAVSLLNSISIILVITSEY